MSMFDHPITQSGAMRSTRPYAAIDLARLQRLGMVTSLDERTAAAEEFRLIKRPLLRHALAARQASQANGNLIMVTSAAPGDGKTHCAINLAMSIAMEKDHRVLLVDADVARPSVFATLGLRAGPGLLDVLLGEAADLSEVIVRTNVPNLTLLPAGRGHRHATELLASQHAAQLLAELAGRYPDRIIVFDTAPVLLTSAAGALCTRMGQAVLVVAAHATTAKELTEVLKRLDSCERIELILNKHDEPSDRYYGRAA